MYTNIYYDRERNRISLWDDKFGYRSFPYKKYAYIEDAEGDFSTIFGTKVKKITSWNNNMEDKLYESDLSPEMRTLIDVYYDSPDNLYPDNNIVILDIEVETSHSLPDVYKAENAVTGISIHESKNDKYYSFILDLDNKIDDSKIFTDSKGNNVILKACISESQMLQEFINLIVLIKPTILTGWNIEFFDIPYLINRIAGMLGEAIVKTLSPINIIRYSEFKKRYIIAGISIIDYLSIYKKFTFSEEASYRLDSIAKKEIGRGKTGFDCSLQELYEKDIHKFIEYNINDVELVLEIDKKKKFIDLVVGISHKGRIPYEDIFYSSRYLEGAILCDLKSKNLVAPNKPNRTLTRDVSFIGAYVKDPKVGFHEWVFDLDLTSLYPSIIMSLNISPETKVGKILDWNANEFTSRKQRTWKVFNFIKNVEADVDTKDLWDFLEVSKYYISSNGIIYQSTHQREGVIPKILSKWFDERVEYKNLMKKFGKDNKKDKYDFYDRLQNIQKVLLNSLYGVLGLPIFRFYDLDNAASVTETGRSIIKFSEKKGDEYFNNVLKTNNNYCLAGDTDSVGKDSVIDTNLYGKITLLQCFDNLTIRGECDIYSDISNRKFIFPDNLVLPYYDEDNKEISYGKVKYIEKHIINKRMFRIKTKSGKFVDITEDHSLMILDESTKKLKEIKPNKLKKGDKIIKLKYDIDEVDEIIDLGIKKEVVFDVGMDDSPHTFFANNILVHNSVYFSASPLLKYLYPNLDYSNEKLATDAVSHIVSDVQKYINDSYDDFAKEILNITTGHRFNIKQELICKSGLWTAKKRYALKVVNREGILVDKLEVKGLDTVRSSFPPAFKGFLEKMLISILDKESQDKIDDDIVKMENKLNSFTINEVSKNTSITDIVKYTDEVSGYYADRIFSAIKKATPAHVRAAIAFNDLLKYYGLDNSISPIKNGEKIKWCYLKNNNFGLDKIAFRGYDDPKEILDFVNTYIDRQRIYESELKSKIENIYAALQWKFPSRYKKLAKQFFNI